MGTGAVARPRACSRAVPRRHPTRCWPRSTFGTTTAVRGWTRTSLSSSVSLLGDGPPPAGGCGPDLDRYGRHFGRPDLEDAERARSMTQPHAHVLGCITTAGGHQECRGRGSASGDPRQGIYRDGAPWVSSRHVEAIPPLLGWGAGRPRVRRARGTRRPGPCPRHVNDRMDPR